MSWLAVTGGTRPIEGIVAWAMVTATGGIRPLGIKINTTRETHGQKGCMRVASVSTITGHTNRGREYLHPASVSRINVFLWSEVQPMAGSLKKDDPPFLVKE